MEPARIVEDGTPDALNAGSGRFAQLHATWRDSRMYRHASSARPRMPRTSIGLRIEWLTACGCRSAVGCTSRDRSLQPDEDGVRLGVAGILAGVLLGG